MSGPYQRAECETCHEQWEGPTALMTGKNHAETHDHTVYWLQETTGYFNRDEDGRVKREGSR